MNSEQGSFSRWELHSTNGCFLGRVQELTACRKLQGNPPPNLSVKGLVAKGKLVDPFIMMGIASSDFR